MSEKHDDVIARRMAAELKAPVRLDEAFDRRVMREVRRTRRPGARPRLVHSLVRPRSFTVSPLIGLAAAAGFAGIVAFGTLTLARDPAATGHVGRATAAASAPTVSPRAETTLVQFVLVAPEASGVSLVGDFNDWDAQATPLRAVSRGGVWTVHVPLAAGRHEYAFVVDGTRWIPDPAAPPAPDDDFGISNSVVTVSGSST